MAEVSQMITLGIGTPGDRTHILTVGLSILIEPGDVPAGPMPATTAAIPTRTPQVFLTIEDV